MEITLAIWSLIGSLLLRIDPHRANCTVEKLREELIHQRYWCRSTHLHQQNVGAPSPLANLDSVTGRPTLSPPISKKRIKQSKRFKKMKNAATGGSAGNASASCGGKDAVKRQAYLKQRSSQLAGSYKQGDRVGALLKLGKTGKTIRTGNVGKYSIGQYASGNDCCGIVQEIMPEVEGALEGPGVLRLATDDGEGASGVEDGPALSHTPIIAPDRAVDRSDVQWTLIEQSSASSRVLLTTSD
jgi:hypothetical protein